MLELASIADREWHSEQVVLDKLSRFLKVWKIKLVEYLGCSEK